MNRTTFSTTALFALCAPLSLACAQGIVNTAGGEAGAGVETRYFMRGPSQQEQAYVEGLSGALEAPLAATNVVSVRFLNEAPSVTQASTPPGSNSYTTGRGLAVELDGLEVERLRFRNAAEAERYALYAVPTDRHPMSVEVRGRQVVVIHGEGLADPEQAAEIREAAWDGLPAPEGPPSVAATYLDSDQFFIENRTKDPELRRAIERAVEAAEERQKAGVEGFEVDENGARINLPSGFQSEVEREGAVDRIWAAPNAEAAEAIEEAADTFAEDSEELSGEVSDKPKSATKTTAQNKGKSKGKTKSKAKGKTAQKGKAKGKTAQKTKPSARKKKSSPKKVTAQRRRAQSTDDQPRGDQRGLRQRILESTDATGPR